jgi:hypothetical protein
MENVTRGKIKTIILKKNSVQRTKVALCYRPEGRELHLRNISGRTRPWDVLSPQQKCVPEAEK